MPIEEVEKNIRGFWERLNHPVLGAFIWSWMIWNWEIVHTLICGIKDSAFAINEINSKYLNVSQTNHLIWFPFWSTVIFVIVGPPLRNAYISCLNWWVTKRRYLDDLVGGHEPIKKSEYVQQEFKYNRLLEEKVVIESAYNLIRNRSIRVEDPNRPRNFITMEAKDVAQRFFEISKELVVLKDENIVLKADLREMKRDNAGRNP